MAMIFTDPRNVVFESDMDVVNYVSAGMVPDKKSFEAVMGALHTPGCTEEMSVVQTGETKTIAINMDAVPDPELLEKYMRAIYENRRKERIANIVTGVSLAVAAFSFGRMMGYRKAEKDLATPETDNRHFLCVGGEAVDGDIPEIY